MPTSHSSKCLNHTWVSTTASGWRFCLTCKTVQRLFNGDWNFVTTEKVSTPRTRRTQPQQTVLEDRSTPKGHKVREGFYIDDRSAETDMHTYWG